MAHSSGLPKTGDAQEIGRDAGDCLAANKPKGWILKDLSGTDDYGLDYQVQISRNQLVQDKFQIQLKGTRSPALSADRSHYSIALSTSTLRYYDNLVEPILLILCDLSVDPDEPNNCPLFYVWIRSELQRIGIDNIPLTQDSATLRVPTINRLTKATDLLEEVRNANALAKLGLSLSVKVEVDKPGMDVQERINLLIEVET